jgi:hypothetical protein
MKKIVLGMCAFTFIIALSSCGLFKKKCNCPKFEARTEIKR